MKPSELFKDEDQWCKTSYAANREGKCVAFGEPTACRWCLAGRIFAVTPRLEPYGDLPKTALTAAIVKAINKITAADTTDWAKGTVVTFNDSSFTDFDRLQEMLKLADTYYEQP